MRAHGSRTVNEYINYAHDELVTAQHTSTQQQTSMQQTATVFSYSKHNKYASAPDANISDAVQ